MTDYALNSARVALRTSPKSRCHFAEFLREMKGFIGEVGGKE
jgi:hypothetical protein